ncbi:MAG TPA: hypothetical protein VGM92_03590 [Candidatus Kapabacteria bacterium]
MTQATTASSLLRGRSLDHDIEAVAVGFGKRFASRLTGGEFGTTTNGVTYRRVDPLREAFEVADTRLQSRLETLCEALRAKY